MHDGVSFDLLISLKLKVIQFLNYCLLTLFRVISKYFREGREDFAAHQKSVILAWQIGHRKYTEPQDSRTTLDELNGLPMGCQVKNMSEWRVLIVVILTLEWSFYISYKSPKGLSSNGSFLHKKFVSKWHVDQVPFFLIKKNSTTTETTTTEG